MVRKRKEDEKEEGKGNDSGGCSVTLEEIRRLSSPLMTVEIVFLEGGEMSEISSLFCVASRASCVRFRLRVSLPQQRPIVSEPQKVAQCWVIDRATQLRRPNLNMKFFYVTSSNLIPCKCLF